MSTSPSPSDPLDLERELGSSFDLLMNFTSPKIDRERLHLPGRTFVDDVVAASDRPNPVLRSLQALFDAGSLGGTGYLSILPVDQGLEHSAGASFASNPDYFDPEAIVELAHEGGCNAVTSSVGVLGAVSRKYAHRIPFIVKLNHNELLTHPARYDQILFASVRQARDLGAVGVGATIYFGSAESSRQIAEVSDAFQCAHEAGLFTVLWCYLRNSAFKKDGVDYHTSADMTGQANHIGVTIQADIVKQKLPTRNGGFEAIPCGKVDKDREMYTKLASEHPIDLVRYQVANGYMGRAGLINSGGASTADDRADAIKTAVINKRAGGMGLIMGRKAFQRPRRDGIELLRAVQNVYLDERVTVV